MALSLHHIIREPKVIKDKNPLLLLLHGYGSNEQDLFSFASELPDAYYVISARAPYDLQYGSYAWYAINFDADQNKFSDEKQAVASRDLIGKFIDELVAEYPIDPDEITIIGFSQGGILGYAVALTYPEKIKRLAALSSYLNQDIIQMATPEKLNHLDIYSSHGTMDQVIPISWSRQAPELLKDMGLKHIFKEYPIGHGVSPQNFYDLLAWLNGK
jgi:phospholipase/carboxylesterase